MPKVIESISILNSTVRTLLALVLVGGLGVGAWFGYDQYYAKEREAQRAVQELTAAQGQLTLISTELAEKKQQLVEQLAEIESLEERVREQTRQIEQLDTAMRLLKVEHRVARLSVLDQEEDPDTGELSSLVEFQELNEGGEPVGATRQFRVLGEQVYIDSWIVKFDDKYVEQADLHRSTSLVMFRRIFGEAQQPKQGFALDQQGTRPAVYGQGTQLSEYEKKIWEDFWNVANDEQLQAELGVRAAHGEAPSIRVKKGRVYRIELRASGGLTVKAESEDDKQVPSKPAA